MRNITFPALIALAVAGTFYAMTAAPSAASEEQASVKLAARDVGALAPYLEAAAKELGYKNARGYDSGVFIETGDDKIAFVREKGGLTLHVAVESRYRHTKSERPAALQALQDKGRAVYETALQLQARASVREQMASARETRPAG